MKKNPEAGLEIWHLTRQAKEASTQIACWQVRDRLQAPLASFGKGNSVHGVNYLIEDASSVALRPSATGHML